MYALLASAVVGSLLFSPGDRTRAGDEWLISAGRSVKHRGEFGHEGLYTVEYRPGAAAVTDDPDSRWGRRWRDLHPVFGLGASPDHTLYLYAGWRKELRWGPVRLSPSFSPVLFQPFGDSDPHARLQFRTAIEVHALPVGAVELGGGYFHISNGTLNRSNADIDALFLSLRLRF